MAFKISLFMRRNDRTIDLSEQTNANTNKQVTWYSIQIKVVPFDAEEEENKKPSKQRNKEANKDINKNKLASK